MSQIFATSNNDRKNLRQDLMTGDFDYEAVIRRILDRNRWGSEGEMASALGISPNTWTAYKQGKRSFGLNEITRICDVLDLSAQELLFGALPAQPFLPVPGEAHVMVPRYDLAASAGPGLLPPAEPVAEYLPVGRNWLRHFLPRWAGGAQLGVLDGAGDSMEPTIFDGDYLMVAHDPPWWVVEAGGIFVLTVDERLLLKRLHVTDQGALEIISDNPRYPAWSVRMDDIPHRVIVHAQVFFVGGKPRG